MRLRIYFTEFDESRYNALKRILSEEYGQRLVEHRARLVKEFRYIEILNASYDDEEKVRGILGEKELKAKVDVV